MSRIEKFDPMTRIEKLDPMTRIRRNVSLHGGSLDQGSKRSRMET